MKAVSFLAFSSPPLPRDQSGPIDPTLSSRCPTWVGFVSRVPAWQVGFNVVASMSIALMLIASIFFILFVEVVVELAVELEAGSSLLLERRNGLG